MIRFTLSAAAAALVAVAAEAGAQASVLDDRLDARTRSSVQRLVDSAQAVGLPGEPLVLKALEGASKGADGARITMAVRRLAGTLGEARQALGSAKSEEIAAGASAIQAGIPATVLREIAGARGSRPMLVALSVMTDLVVSGVPVDVARDAVVALARAGVPDEQLLAFRRQVGLDIHSGMLPAAAAAGSRGGGSPALPAGATGGRPPVQAAPVPAPAPPVSP